MSDSKKLVESEERLMIQGIMAVVSMPDGELRALVGLADDGSPLIQFMDERKQPTWTMR